MKAFQRRKLLSEDNIQFYVYIISDQLILIRFNKLAPETYLKSLESNISISIFILIDKQDLEPYTGYL